MLKQPTSSMAFCEVKLVNVEYDKLMSCTTGTEHSNIKMVISIVTPSRLSILLEEEVVGDEER